MTSRAEFKFGDVVKIEFGAERWRFMLVQLTASGGEPTWVALPIRYLSVHKDIVYLREDAIVLAGPAETP